MPAVGPGAAASGRSMPSTLSVAAAVPAIHLDVKRREVLEGVVSRPAVAHEPMHGALRCREVEVARLVREPGLRLLVVCGLRVLRWFPSGGALRKAPQAFWTHDPSPFSRSIPSTTPCQPTTIEKRKTSMLRSPSSLSLTVAMYPIVS